MLTPEKPFQTDSFKKKQKTFAIAHLFVYEEWNSQQAFLRENTSPTLTLIHTHNW